MIGFPYWKLTWKNERIFSHVLVYRGTSLYYTAVRDSGSAKIIFSFPKTKAVKVSDLIVNKCPKKREKTSRSSRALYQAYDHSKVPRSCVNKLDWHTDFKHAYETSREALQSPKN